MHFLARMFCLLCLSHNSPILNMDHEGTTEGFRMNFVDPSKKILGAYPNSFERSMQTFSVHLNKSINWNQPQLCHILFLYPLYFESLASMTLIWKWLKIEVSNFLIEEFILLKLFHLNSIWISYKEQLFSVIIDSFIVMISIFYTTQTGVSPSVTFNTYCHLRE